HAVALDGNLATSDSSVHVEWSVGDTPPIPVPRRFLWSGPAGSLLGEVRPLPDEWPAASSPCRPGADTPAVAQRRLDGFLGFRDAPGALQSRRPLAACWSGDLRVARPGEYEFEIVSNGGSRLLVDGNQVVDNRHDDGPPKESAGRVELKPGTHRLEVEYSWRREVGYLEVSWTPPGGARALIGGE